MNDTAKEILAMLDANQIPYTLVQHPAAFTMEDCIVPEKALQCVVPKNLVLTPRNRSAFYLCITSPNIPFKTSDISKQIPSSRLSFATEEDLQELLHTYAGAASPLGLLFDKAQRVRFLMDDTLTALPRLGFHPNDNEYTVGIQTQDFLQKLLPLTGHSVQFVHPNIDKEV